jgi:hypothetical protein
MHNYPESIHDAINTSELGALIADHRNAFLCDLLRPVLDTLDREGIQLSAVLRALGTIARERSSTLPDTNGSNPWNQCDGWLQKAHLAAIEAERATRPKGTRAKDSALSSGGGGTSAPPAHRPPEARSRSFDPDEDAWAKELLTEA